MRISTAALDRIKTFRSNIKPVCFRTQVKYWQMRVRARFPSKQVMPQASSSAWSWALSGTGQGCHKAGFLHSQKYRKNHFRYKYCKK